MVKVLSALLAHNLLQNEKLMQGFSWHEMWKTEDRKKGPKISNPCEKKIIIPVEWVSYYQKMEI